MPKRSQTEYIAVLDGSRIDSNGFKTSYGVTAYTQAEAVKLLTKAKRYYCGTTRIDRSRFYITKNQSNQ